MSEELQGQGQVPNASGGQEPPASEQQNAADVQGQEPERFDAEYVKKLRAEAAEYRRRLRELEQTVKQHEEAKLTESERLQKRLAELEREQATWQRERQEHTLRYEAMLSAQRLGLVDPEAAYRLLDRAAVEFDDDGRPRNIEQLLRDLVKTRPWLAGQTAASGLTTNPATGQTRTATFTASQLADRRFWEEHREEIMKALAEGRILPG